MPGARRTRSLVCENKAYERSHHRYAAFAGIPRAMVLTACFVISLVTGLSCHHRPEKRELPKSLTPASGCRDHTTSPSAFSAFVVRTKASIASRINVRDDRDTPLL